MSAFVPLLMPMLFLRWRFDTFRAFFRPGAGPPGAQAPMQRCIPVLPPVSTDTWRVFAGQPLTRRKPESPDRYNAPACMSSSSNSSSPAIY